MSESLSKPAIDLRISSLQNELTKSIQEQITAASGDSVEVTASNFRSFSYKDLKAMIPTQALVATATVGPNASRLYFCMSGESAATLATATSGASSSEAAESGDHIEPVKTFLEGLVTSLLASMSNEAGRQLSLEELRCVMINLSPSDIFASGSLICAIEMQLESKAEIQFVAPREFLSLCFPDIENFGMTTQDVSGQQSMSENDLREMDLVLDIELGVTIELGRTTMLIRDIIKLGQGSIVELDKLSGEPVDLFVNGRRFAKGEVVVVDENFAVRVTELVSPAERVAASRN